MLNIDNIINMPISQWADYAVLVTFLFYTQRLIPINFDDVRFEKIDLPFMVAIIWTSMFFPLPTGPIRSILFKPCVSSLHFSHHIALVSAACGTARLKLKYFYKIFFCVCAFH